MKTDKNVLIVGPGTMGKALATILAKQGWPGSVGLVAKNTKQVEQVLPQVPSGVKVGMGYDFSLSQTDILIIAVKPQNLSEIYQSLDGKLSRRTLVISIAAGVTLKSLTEGLRHPKVIRAMPNTPAKIGQGTTVWLGTEATWAPAVRQLGQKIMAFWGQEYEVTKEDLIDVATAVFGSMPAYLARFMQGLVAGAVKNGFPRQAANELTRQGIQGSLALIQANSSLNLADFCEQVISPGGTTAQAMHVLDQRAFNAILTEAMEAALAQTQKLNR